MMVRQEQMVPGNPFNAYVCNGCGNILGKHWLFKPETFADVRGAGRTPNGKLYCKPDGLSYAGAYHQRFGIGRDHLKMAENRAQRGIARG